MEILRKCKDCGLEAHNKADLALFAHSKTSLYGKLNWCNKCRYIYYHNRRVTNKDILQKRREQGHRHYVNHKEEMSETSRKYRKKHPQKVKARNQAVKIPKKLTCNKCGASEPEVRLERHHPDYSKPEEFETLCSSCHHEIHHLNSKGIPIEV